MLRLLKTSSRFIVLLMVVFLTSVQALAGGQQTNELKTNDITGVLQDAQQKAKDLPLPEKERTGKGRKEAARIIEKFNAPANQARLNKERQRLQDALCVDVPGTPLSKNGGHVQAESDSTMGQVYLFISSSMPLTTLRNYAAMIDRARTGQVIMVLRGFVGGMKKIGPTMKFIGEILKKDPTCDQAGKKCESFQVNIEVDPLLFQRFAIEKVPAVAYLPAGKSDVPDAEPEPLIIAGDAGLDYLLERINREAKTAGLRTLVASLRGRN